LKSSENQEFLCNLSFPEKIFYDHKRSQNTNKFYDLFGNEQQIYHCPTRRILSQDTREHFEIVYEIHNGFTLEQLSIIENALQIVINRLFKPEILQNMYQICVKSDCFVTDEVWSHSNLTKHTIYNDKYLLLQYQLMCLKTTSENGEFPTINIYPTHDKNEKENNNCSTCLSCISHGSTFLIDGEFKIKLDQHKLNGSGENSSNALFWAGEIVYQMLRNLGHRCDDNCDTNRSQINVFKRCFLYDGIFFLNKTT